ncbi:DUF2262 domain-containing protein [Pleionea sp. CnH1-48]|uniref:DUF2262 domain-containing protein n=1 Tax=Pleionea sp. CnH1-48 TaxID=2954494 RepID=UPI002097B39C|nr:DUF2262 domain-containing protein [Pleionea sp. CnH1-48]MCO7227610.1 DUF2262 domain-containing protein [Pleionea sp. CnH1-48]
MLIIDSKYFEDSKIENGFYQCSINWNKGDVLFQLCDEGEYLRANISIGSDIIENESKWAKKLREVLLKDIHGKTWAETEGEVLTEEEFMKKVELCLIVIEDSTISFWYDDGELYCGHNIIVSSDPSGNEINAYMA